jgi:hypothetical protein
MEKLSTLLGIRRLTLDLRSSPRVALFFQPLLGAAHLGVREEDPFELASLSGLPISTQLPRQ